MRFAIWSIILAAVAVGVALFARNSTGYVVIVSAAVPHRAVAEPARLPRARAATSPSTSLARLVTTLVAIPARVRAYRAERHALAPAPVAERRAARVLPGALRLGGEERGQRRCRATRPRAWPRSSRRAAPTSSAASTSASSSSTRPRARRRSVDQARLTTLADLLVSQGRYDEALAVLKDLSARDARNLRLLRLKLQAEQALRNWDEVLATARRARQAGRHRARPRLPRSRRAAHLGNLNRKSQDAGRARRVLETDARRRCASIPPSRPPRRAITWRSAGNAEAQAIIEQALEREWNSSLVALYGEAGGRRRVAADRARREVAARARARSRRCCSRSASCACARSCGARRRATSRRASRSSPRTTAT